MDLVCSRAVISRSLLPLAQSAPERREWAFAMGPLHVSATMLERVGFALLHVLATIVVALLLLRLIPAVQRFVVHWASRSSGKPGATESMIDRRQKIETLTGVTSSVAQGVIWGATAMALLEAVGISIGPLLAGAGIAGVAVGFGAQSIVKDFFAGFFILLENQFDVGDTVTIASTTGVVERMTMRITVLRDAAGTAYFIPNSTITTVANKTYGWGRTSIDAVFATTVSDAAARAVLDAAATRANEMLQASGAMIEPVVVEGPAEFAASGVTWRLAGKTRAAMPNEAKRAMISALGEALRAQGFAIDGGAFVKR